MSESCKTCRFWSDAKPEKFGEHTMYFGSCRRRSPTGSVVDSVLHNQPQWPVTLNDQWCGEYQSADWTRDWVEIARGKLSCRCVNVLEKNGLMRRLDAGRYLLAKSVLSMSVDDLTSLRGVALTLANEITQVLQGK